MFAEKVCEQVVGFSVMAEDELFEVNGGYQADGSGLDPTGRNGGGGAGSDINIPIYDIPPNPALPSGYGGFINRPKP